MRRVGEVVRVANGLLVLRASDESHPDVGTPVVDDQLASVGRGVSIFGPVDRPYVGVTPAEGVDPPGLVGAPLYERD